MTCHRCRPSRLPRVLVADTWWCEADTPDAARGLALREAAALSAALGWEVRAEVEDGTGRALGTALGTPDGRGHWLPAGLAVAAE